MIMMLYYIDNDDGGGVDNVHGGVGSSDRSSSRYHFPFYSDRINTIIM